MKRTLIALLLVLSLTACGSSAPAVEASTDVEIAPSSLEDLDTLQRLFYDVRSSTTPESLEAYAHSLDLFVGKDIHAGKGGQIEFKVAYDQNVAKVRSADTGDYIYVSWDYESSEMIRAEYWKDSFRVTYSPGGGYTYDLYNVKKGTCVDCLEAFGYMMRNAE